MFDFARKNSFLMQIVLFLMIASLVLVLFVDYNMVSGNKPVAKVGNTDIGSQEFDQAKQRYITEQQQRNPGAEAAQFNTPKIQQSILDNMVREQVLLQSANSLKLPVSDQTLSSHVRTLAKEYGWIKADGSIDTAAYKEYLAQQGQSASDFESALRSNLVVNQSLVGVSQTQPDAPKLQQSTLRAFFEPREVQIKGFPAGDIAPQAVTDEEVRRYYDEHPDQFQVPETIDVEYVVLDANSIKQQINPSDEDIAGYYEQNKNRYKAPEQRKISHILIESAGTAETDTQAQAKAKAADLLKQIQADPSQFAELAKTHSNDPGSSAQGGDLGYIKPDGTMVKPFEDAAFALTTEQPISDLVKTQYGYHILQVTDIQGGELPSLEEKKDEIRATIIEGEAQKRYSEEAENFANVVYEAGTMQDVATRFGLPVQTAQKLPQNGGTRDAADAQKAIYAPKFLAELFSEESKATKQNTPAVDIGNNRLVSGRVTHIEPAHTESFDTAQTRAKELLEQANAMATSKTKAEELVTALNAEGTTVESAMKELGPTITVARNLPALPPAIVQAALKMDPANLPQQTTVKLDGTGWTVVRVNKTLPVNDTILSSPQATGQLNYAWQDAMAKAQYEQMKKDAGVEMLWQPDAE